MIIGADRMLSALGRGMARWERMARAPVGLVADRGDQGEATHGPARRDRTQLRRGEALLSRFQRAIGVRLVEAHERTGASAVGADGLLVEVANHHVGGALQRLTRANGTTNGDARTEHRADREVGDVDRSEVGCVWHVAI
jgi:hypothetical protein